MPIKTRIGNMFGQNGSQSKYKCSIIQTEQNTMPKYKWNKILIWQNAIIPKYKHDKIQMEQNTNTTKYKCNKIQMQQNTNETK